MVKSLHGVEYSKISIIITRFPSCETSVTVMCKTYTATRSVLLVDILTHPIGNILEASGA